jgi:hypothetical protein
MVNEFTQKRLKTLFRRLQYLELQRAQKGINTEPEIHMEIDDLREEIIKLEQQYKIVDFLYELSKKQREVLADLLKFFYCPYCRSNLVSYIQEAKEGRVTYGCGYSALIQGEERIEEFEDITSCPNKTADQEKWDEEWREALP